MSFFNDWKSDSSSHSNPPRFDQFDNDDNVGSGPGPASPLPHSLHSPPPSLISRSHSRFHFTSQTTGDSGYVDNPDNDSSSDSGDAKENRQLKTLGRLYPRFMLPAFGVNTRARLSSQPRERGNQRQTSLHISSSDEEDSDNLRPGLARVRVRRGNIRPIKGDTESEDDGTEMAPATFESSFFPSSPGSPPPLDSRGQRNVLRRRSVQPQPQRQNSKSVRFLATSETDSELPFSILKFRSRKLSKYLHLHQRIVLVTKLMSMMRKSQNFFSVAPIRVVPQSSLREKQCGTSY